MTEMAQVNLRVPEETKSTLMRLARLMREDPMVGKRLARFCDEQSDPDIGGILELRLDRLDHQVTAILDKLGMARVPDSTPATTDDDQPKGPAWTMGEGRGRRLTAEGEAELARRLAEGWGDSQIAHHLGVAPFTIATRRKRQG